MAFSYKQRECDTCGGTLEFDKEAEEYVCLYCGNRYEREERYDGQFSVRYAATQALNALLDVDDDLSNWSLVQDNLNDCRKIDPSYPGTIVAQMAASVVRVRCLLATASREAVRADLSEAQNSYAKLGAAFDPKEQDVEADFYDGLESSDIRSLLIGVFTTFKDADRAEYIRQGFHADSIHSEQAANDLVSRSFANGDYQRIDEILQAPAKVDADALFSRILDEYPESERKTENIAAVVLRGVDEQHGRDALSAYLRQSKDAAAIKLDIVISCIGRGIIPKGDALGALIRTVADDKRLLSLFTMLKGDVLSDEDIGAIVGALMAQSRVDIMVKSLNALADAGYYLPFSQQSMVAMLNRADLTVDDKIAAYQAIVKINLPNKRRQSVFAAFAETPMPAGGTAADDKVRIIDALADSMPALNPMSVEGYLMSNGIDGEAKPRVLDAMLSHVTARESLKVAAKRYVASSTDAQDVHAAVVGVLGAAGLVDGVAPGGRGAYIGMGGGPGSAAGSHAGAGAGASDGSQAPAAQPASSGRPQPQSQPRPSAASRQPQPQADEVPIPPSHTRLDADTVINYVLHGACHATKPNEVERVLQDSAVDARTLTTKVAVGGHVVEAPLLHAYLLTTKDSKPVARMTIQKLERVTPKVNCRVTMDGEPVRFRKLVQSGDVPLPDATRDYCMAIRMF